MQAVVSLLLGSVLLTAMACSGGVGYVPTTPTPTPSPGPPPPPRPTVPVTAIALGELVHSRIGIEDPICDPEGWDATAPCKRFSVVATRDGVLEAVMTAPSALGRGEVIDMLLDCPQAGDYSGGGVEQHVTARVSSGQSCTITINTYPYLWLDSGGIAFDLRTQL
jgi:hypothetical protein